jgi:dTDP-3-amino-3,4,6-trideoxy-alpha-D-glucose transaminase
MIPLNDFKRQWADVGEATLKVVAEIGGSGWYILGREVAAFEAALAGTWGLPFAAGVASGLDAIELALKALGCGPGDKVLTTPISAFATTLAIVKLGAEPVFTDTDPLGNIDLELCREVLATRQDIRFFVPVHLYGHPLDMRKLAALGRDFDCGIVEDCAHSIGATHEGVPTGTAGCMAATSFYPTKNLGAMGDGGAVLTANRDLAHRVRMLRDYGQSAKDVHTLVGYNSRLDELHAALLRQVGLQCLPKWLTARCRNASAYVSGITNPAITLCTPPQDTRSSWHLFPVWVAPERKPDFIHWLNDRGIVCGQHYPIPIPEQPVMAELKFEMATDIPVARRLCRSEVTLPVHPYLTEAEVAQVIEACNAWKGYDLHV